MQIHRMERVPTLRQRVLAAAEWAIRTRAIRRTLIQLGSLALLFPSAAEAQTLFAVYPDYVPTLHISRDGSVIVGWQVEIDVENGLLWTDIDEHMRAVSGDGSIRVFDNGTGNALPSIDVDGVITQMPFPGYPYDSVGVTDISGDGNRLVGFAKDLDAPGLYPMTYDRLTQTYQISNPTHEVVPGFEIPLQFALYEAISTDGSTIVGTAPSPYAPLEYEAMRVDTTGSAEFLNILDLIPGTTFAAAQAVSADGSTISGWISDYWKYAWVWEDGVASLLGFEGSPTAITSNGYRIVGASCFEVVCGGDPSWHQHRAFYYTPDTGRRSVEEALENEYGVDLAGWSLLSVEDISDDGLVMAGRAMSPAGQLGSWAVKLPAPVEITLPEPGLPMGLAVSAAWLAMGARRRSRIHARRYL